ncbi:MAG TPA: hypothetical protein VGR91_01230 [Stellaceae bacterium]|nr:hypothetical protein [Stellaceae bacterium]
MTKMSQGDLFAAAAGAPKPVSPEIPDPDAIRTRLTAMLALVRDATKLPWEVPRARAQEHLFHNMAAWLPPDERDALRTAFVAEMNRLREIDGRA